MISHCFKKLDKHPEVYMIIATLFLTLFGATGKVAIPLAIIVFSRFFIPLLVVSFFTLRDEKKLKSYFKDMTWLDFGRSLFVVGSQYTFFFCVKHTTLFNANALLNTAPAFILILYFFYNKSCSFNKILGIAVGFLGVLLILKPEPGAINMALLMGLLAGFCWAMSNFTQSLMLEKHTNEKCMFYYYFHGTALSLVILIFCFRSNWIHSYLNINTIIVLLIFSGCTLGFQYFSGRAYKISSAFHLAPYLYLTILFSWLVDYFILHVQSPRSAMIGAIFIFAGTLLSRLTRPINYFFIKEKVKPSA